MKALIIFGTAAFLVGFVVYGFTAPSCPKGEEEYLQPNGMTGGYDSKCV